MIVRGRLGIIMTGEERRKAIIEIISESTKPVSGTALAKQFQVSRQVIVQDIALLRAADYDIYSAARGYMLMPSLSENKNKEVSKDTDAITRVFHVSHTDEQMEDELNTIVDMGGRVLDVYVEHAVYGAIRTALPIACRRHVQEFMSSIHSGKSTPLKNLTAGDHYHTVEADDEDTLDYIEKALKEKGYLCSE